MSVKAQLKSWPLLDSWKWIGSWGTCIVLFNPTAHLSRFYFICFYCFSSVQKDFIFTWQNTPVTMLYSVSLFQMCHGETKWLRICFNAFWSKFWVYLITHRNSLCVNFCKSTLSGWALWESQKHPECMRQEHKACSLHASISCIPTIDYMSSADWPHGRRLRRHLLFWTVEAFFPDVEVWEAFQRNLNDAGCHLELIPKGATYTQR